MFPDFDCWVFGSPMLFFVLCLQAGIHGFVADNFECHEYCYTAISATTGRQLLYLIVRDQQVAQEVLKLLGPFLNDVT